MNSISDINSLSSSANETNSDSNSNYDTSVMNRFSPPSTSSSEEFRRTGREISEAHYRRIIQEIINKIFDDKSGIHDSSSSACSSAWEPSSEYSFDRRLQYWKTMLTERQRIAATIKKKTGKIRDDVLFNRPVTVDERDKDMVKRLLDYAQRMNPLVLCTRRLAELPEMIVEKQYAATQTMDPCGKNEYQQLEVKYALQETLPQAERIGCVDVEISGLPSQIKVEQLGPQDTVVKTRSAEWLKAPYLERCILERRADIERVIEHFPDISRLVVRGEGLSKSRIARQSSAFQLLGEKCIERISSDSTEAEVVVKKQILQPPAEPVVFIEYAVKINQHLFTLQPKRNAKVVEMDFRFHCQPFQREQKHIIRLENVGERMLDFEWLQRSPYEKAPMLLKPLDNEFATDRKPFRLKPHEVRDVYMVFQPRKVGVVRENWVLKISPQFFCRRNDTVLMRFYGNCWPSPDYWDKLTNVQLLVIEKSNLKMTRKLTTSLGSLTPHLITEPEATCPYQRIISERECFALHNPGYTCERYHDLKLLRDLYHRAKKPREKAWDLRIETLKDVIMRVENADSRTLFFAEMLDIVESMKITVISKCDTELLQTEQPEECNERERTRFIFVRGLIVSAIEDWEELSIGIEDAFLTPAIKHLTEQLLQADKRLKSLPPASDNNAPKPVDTDTETEPELPVQLLEDEDALRKHVWLKNTSCKAFRDTLFMQTYSLLCNLIEDMVSIIEGMEVI